MPSSDASFFPHLSPTGDAHMVDVSDKSASKREAVAEGWLHTTAAVVEAITQDKLKKGDALATARIAGIMGAKKTSDLIPLCHPLPLSHVAVVLSADTTQNAIHIQATCRITGKTGVEMEALTAVATAALTLYDMIKAHDKSAHIDGLRLLHKSGGKSGDYTVK
jgi:cyclic pyranopterin phosphate synthase